MDLLGVLRACVRRWWVFLPVVGLTAWLCWQQFQQARPEYTSTAAVVVAPSPDLVISRGRQANDGPPVITPFNGGEGPRVLAGLLVSALNTSTVRQQLLPAGGAALLASRDVQQDATVVNLQVVAEDAGSDAAALAAVRAGVNDVVHQVQLQAGAPQDQLYDAVPGGPVDPPLVAYPDRVRGVVAIALAGMLAAVVLSVLAQSLLRGRRKPSQEQEQKKQRAPRTPKGRRPVASGKRSARPPHGDDPTDVVDLSGARSHASVP